MQYIMQYIKICFRKIKTLQTHFNSISAVVQYNQVTPLFRYIYQNIANFYVLVKLFAFFHIYDNYDVLFTVFNFTS